MTNRDNIKEKYNDQGFAVVEGAFRPDELEPLRSLLQKQVDDRARLFFSTGKLDELFETEPLQSRLFRLGERCPELRRGWRPSGSESLIPRTTTGRRTVALHFVPSAARADPARVLLAAGIGPVTGDKLMSRATKCTSPEKVDTFS